MKTFKGDIWKLKKTHTLVIPVNIGWKADGTNVMGRGLAQQAAKKYPELPAWWGVVCRHLQCFTGVTPYHSAALIMFPTKSLSDPPHLTWKARSDPVLVRFGLHQLRVWARRFNEEYSAEIALPLVGTGNGRLDEGMVRGWIREILGRLDNVTLVELG